MTCYNNTEIICSAKYISRRTTSYLPLTLIRGYLVSHIADIRIYLFEQFEDGKKMVDFNVNCLILFLSYKSPPHTHYYKLI